MQSFRRSIVLLTPREPSPARCGRSFKVILSERKSKTDIIRQHAMVLNRPCTCS